MVIESTALVIAVSATAVAAFQAVKEVISHYVKKREKTEIQIEIEGQKLSINLNNTEEAAEKLEKITSLIK